MNLYKSCNEASFVKTTKMHDDSRSVNRGVTSRRGRKEIQTAGGSAHIAEGGSMLSRRADFCPASIESPEERTIKKTAYFQRAVALSVGETAAARELFCHLAYSHLWPHNGRCEADTIWFCSFTSMINRISVFETCKCAPMILAAYPAHMVCWPSELSSPQLLLMGASQQHKWGENKPKQKQRKENQATVILVHLCTI